MKNGHRNAFFLLKIYSTEDILCKLIFIRIIPASIYYLSGIGNDDPELPLCGMQLLFQEAANNDYCYPAQQRI
ncbi:hypothetical protein AR543_20555 [Paenibacillus bovis]|uniref:Uncharacterized protein n=1 Tax=Paenibacillus bovis TaxID=1616788 RepID=A0A172ZKK1_9BACL|nr:hypothetical protein AR543_20555 [Paenibacillus bovis]